MDRSSTGSRRTRNSWGFSLIRSNNRAQTEVNRPRREDSSIPSQNNPGALDNVENDPSSSNFHNQAVATRIIAAQQVVSNESISVVLSRPPLKTPQLDKIGALVRKTVRSMHNSIIHRYPPRCFMAELSRLEKWTDDTDRLREAVTSAGGISVLLLLFKLPYGNEPEVLVKVCNIFTFMARNANCLEALTAEGAINAVLSAMKRHVHQTKLQARACNSLNNLAMTEENRAKIAHEGGIVQIIEAMTQHGNDAEVQANGCNAIWNLAICSGNRSRICKANGAQTIVQAMSRHMDDSALFGEGCGALWNLADHPPTRTNILGEGGINVILTAMKRHPNELMMHRLCCGALESLINDSDIGRVALFKRIGGIPLVIAAMRANPEDEELQSACCGIVSSLAVGDLMNLAVPVAFSTYLAQCGAIPLLLAALDRHPSSSKLQCRVCSAISNLSYDRAVKEAMISEGAVDTVKGALLQNAGDAVVFGTALMALSQLNDTSLNSSLELYSRAA
mmetsp:Transcript_10114/g.13359  ORF Transcript_10114/g.13359 Transcript_10114/m.13359 type:complete len:506 (-) Transcript_10114:65-1582(-)|eukprot:CAMPEP_0198147974 /NCGR_PEP_ID=MMETSP1443-20131203/38903_1 /TAXON_ID=186043 /ORGANISM="Entomoneis sp., Strain CCMP2396" /LENGTH=505 /DNA_ID=CAMNT_0043812519 /DNA_START=106 /DNA_END=1623 /DNA_ORIENTATION=+